MYKLSVISEFSTNFLQILICTVIFYTNYNLYKVQIIVNAIFLYNMITCSQHIHINNLKHS